MLISAVHTVRISIGEAQLFSQLQIARKLSMLGIRKLQITTMLQDNRMEELLVTSLNLFGLQQHKSDAQFVEVLEEAIGRLTLCVIMHLPEITMDSIRPTSTLLNDETHPLNPSKNIINKLYFTQRIFDFQDINWKI